MKTTNEQSQQAEATKTAKTAKKSATKSKFADYVFQSSSAYGITVEVLCMAPDASKAEILEAVTNAGIDVKAHKNAVTTGISQSKKVIELLRSNELMK